MIDIEALKPQIVERLKPLNPEKIILFGSYAYGTPNEESDIDLYVVTGDDFIPKNFDEKMKLKLKVAKAIDAIRDRVSVDTIVHTKPMAKLFKEMNNSFYNEINKGIVLL